MLAFQIPWRVHQLEREDFAVEGRAGDNHSGATSVSAPLLLGAAISCHRTYPQYSRTGSFCPPFFLQTVCLLLLKHVPRWWGWEAALVLRAVNDPSKP